MKRAYSVLEIKGMDEGERVIEGIATTPETDRMGDVVEPKGATFKLPIPLLWSHDSTQPIGHVERAKVTPQGIEVWARIVKVNDAGRLKERLDEAWHSIKSGLVRGLSIGFRPIDTEPIKGTFGLKFTAWEWLELSTVVVPANSDASITAIKSADFNARRTEVLKSLRQASRPTAGNGSPAAAGHRNILLPE